MPQFLDQLRNARPQGRKTNPPQAKLSSSDDLARKLPTISEVDNLSAPHRPAQPLHRCPELWFHLPQQQNFHIAGYVLAAGGAGRRLRLRPAPPSEEPCRQHTRIVLSQRLV